MNDELIKALRHCAECDHQGCAADCRFGKEHPLNFICIDYLQREAADAIEELGVVVRTQKAVLDKFPRWVPVTERLPDAGERVLCYCRANICEVMKMRTDGDWVYDTNHIYMHSFVTHWMPLPQPPKEE